jgi:hypothetical protein
VTLVLAISLQNGWEKVKSVDGHTAFREGREVREGGGEREGGLEGGREGRREGGRQRGREGGRERETDMWVF